MDSLKLYIIHAETENSFSFATPLDFYYICLTFWGQEFSLDT